MIDKYWFELQIKQCKRNMEHASKAGDREALRYWIGKLDGLREALDHVLDEEEQLF